MSWIRGGGGTATLALAAAGLVACGGDGGSAGASASGDGGESRRAAAERFAQCMREQGVRDFPDPDERGMFEITPESDGRAPSATRERAQRACGKHLRAAGPPPELSDDEQAEHEDRLVRFNRCMRERGVDLPAPEVDGRQAAQPLGDSSRESPAFRRALQACEAELGGIGR